ncbi:hypothetical protein Tco_0408771 [Tanacetum coccineum]
MITLHLTPFLATTPCAGVFDSFVIISDSDEEIATLLVKPAPPSPDRTMTLCGYPLDSRDDSSNENLTAMNRWRAASPSTYHLLLPSEIPLSTSSPPSLLPSSSCKRSRSPSPSLPSSASPSPPPTAVPPPPKNIESVRDDIETLPASLTSAMQETMTLHARVGSLKQQDVVTPESLRIVRGRFTQSQLRVEYAEHEFRDLQEFWITTDLRWLSYGVERRT